MRRGRRILLRETRPLARRDSGRARFGEMTSVAQETDKLESGVRRTSLYRSYVRGPNLVLAEVLLALIAANQARAEVTRAAPELPPSSPREVRQLDFRELLVRSLSYTPPSRL